MKVRCKKVSITLLSCYKLNRCYIKLSLVNILEMVFVFIEMNIYIHIFTYKYISQYLYQCIFFFTLCKILYNRCFNESIYVLFMPLKKHLLIFKPIDIKPN